MLAITSAISIWTNRGSVHHSLTLMMNSGRSPLEVANLETTTQILSLNQSEVSVECSVTARQAILCAHTCLCTSASADASAKAREWRFICLAHVLHVVRRSRFFASVCATWTRTRCSSGRLPGRTAGGRFGVNLILKFISFNAATSIDDDWGYVLEISLLSRASALAGFDWESEQQRKLKALIKTPVTSWCNISIMWTWR